MTRDTDYWEMEILYVHFLYSLYPRKEWNSVYWRLVCLILYIGRIPTVCIPRATDLYTIMCQKEHCRWIDNPNQQEKEGKTGKCFITHALFFRRAPAVTSACMLRWLTTAGSRNAHDPDHLWLILRYKKWYHHLSCHKFVVSVIFMEPNLNYFFHTQSCFSWSCKSRLCPQFYHNHTFPPWVSTHSQINSHPTWGSRS